MFEEYLLSGFIKILNGIVSDSVSEHLDIIPGMSVYTAVTVTTPVTVLFRVCCSHSWQIHTLSEAVHRTFQSISPYRITNILENDSNKYIYP